MGRKAFFTQEQVFDTADGLIAQGKEVSAKSLLDALGGGSLTTIYRHLSAWQESRPATSNSPAPLVIPDVVQTAFVNAWRVATTQAAQEVSAVRDKAGEEVRTARKQFQEALEQIERLEAESEEDSARIDSLTKQLSELENKLHSLHSELAGEKATVRQLRDQLMSQDVDIARVAKEKELSVTEAAELRGENQTLKQQNKELLARLPQQGKKIMPPLRLDPQTSVNKV
jgi:uncharacterized coiled-coil DUF342 family protein